MIAYTVATLWTDFCNPSEFDAKLFYSLAEARAYFKFQEGSWLSARKEIMESHNENFKEWFSESLITDYDNLDCVCREYIFNDNERMIFTLSKHENLERS